MKFDNNATAGSGSFVVKAAAGGDVGGNVEFFSSASAEDATFAIEGGIVSAGAGGRVRFFDFTTAGNGRFTTKGSAVAGALGGEIDFYRVSTAGSSSSRPTIINEGSPVSGGKGGRTFFSGVSNAWLANLSGTAGVGEGGKIVFDAHATSMGLHVQLAGNAQLDLTSLDEALRLDSLDGNGSVLIGNLSALGLGDNNVRMTFSGPISGGADYVEILDGKVTFAGANTYGGETRVQGGVLLVNNPTGSATGSGPVTVNGDVGGTAMLGGRGTIAGNVVVGGIRPPYGGVLVPGNAGSGALTIQSGLIMLFESAYKWVLNSDHATSARLVTNGVSVQGARLLVQDLGTTTLPSGTVFTMINNTAATPIEGTFSRLSDGASIKIGNNIFQANYEGGDGNDLTLTVISE